MSGEAAIGLIACLPLAIWVCLLLGRGGFWLARERDDRAQPAEPLVWPAVTACSTAAGLLAGILIAGPIRPAAPIAQRTSETSPAGPPSTVAHANEPETVVADAPALMELRIALARRAGNELAWAQPDLSASRGRPAAAGAPAAGAFAPLTYGAALGRLSAEEKDL